MGLAGLGRRGHGVGGGVLACDRGPAAAVRPRGRLAGPSADLGAMRWPYDGLARRFCGGCFADRGGGGDRGRDGSGFARYAAVSWPVFGGQKPRPAADRGRDHGPRAAGQGMGIQWSQWVSAILYNGLGRYEEARAEAQQAAEQAPELYISMWALPELIEAASRSGQTALAADALGRLAEATSVGQTDWGQGIYARCRALLSDGQDAEGFYREAVDRLSRTGFRPELARAHLLYGEWLRRERPAGRRAGAAAHRARDVRRDRHAGVRRAGPPRAAGHRRDRPQAHRRHARPAHPARGPDRPAGPGGPVEPGDRRPAVLVRADGRMAPEQGLHQARDHLPPPAPAGAARQGQRRADGITGRQGREDQRKYMTSILSRRFRLPGLMRDLDNTPLGVQHSHEQGRRLPARRRRGGPRRWRCRGWRWPATAAPAGTIPERR